MLNYMKPKPKPIPEEVRQWYSTIGARGNESIRGNWAHPLKAVSDGTGSVIGSAYGFRKYGASDFRMA